MRAPSELPADLRVYRRVYRAQWHVTGEGAKPKDKTFLDRNQRLSVYAEDRQSPRSVLQHAIRQAEAAGHHDFLDRNGRTVEEMVAKAWRVVQIPLTACLEAGMHFTHADEDGHINLLGDPTPSLDDLIDAAAVLGPTECLR